MRTRSMSRAAWPVALIAAIAFFAGPSAAENSATLPLVRVPAAGDGERPMILLLSGDGDWAPFVREVAELAASAGAPVLGLKMRAYLSMRRTPEEVASALAVAVREQLAEWRRTQLIVIGYSRGADTAPFAINRWPSELRARVRAVAFVGLSEHAGFEFHLDDLIRNVVRPGDLPTRPEIERLENLPLLCLRGETEDDSFCDRPVAGMRTLIHPGGHRAQAGDGTATLLLGALGLTPAAATQTQTVRYPPPP